MKLTHSETSQGSVLDLEPLTPQTLAEEWEKLSSSERVSAFHSLTPGQAQTFFLDLNAAEQADFIVALPESERRVWLRQVAPDDAADLIQQVDDDEVEGLLSLLDDATRREVSTLLAYREDAAGGLMSPRFARLRPEMSVDEAISYLRLQSGRVETVYYAYALDNEQRLVGVVSFRDLFSASLNQTVQQVMRTEYISVTEDVDQEVVAELFAEHRLLAIPVIDGDRRMKGIVTVDDIVEVAREEASEDIQKLGGMAALDAPYLDTSFWQMIRKRGGWLSALFLGEMLTATAMSHYEDEIAKAVVLALFVPLIISSGGNSGSQATTLIIRAMAVGELRLRDWWRVVRREAAAGIVLGSALAVIGLIRVLLWGWLGSAYGEHYRLLAAVVALSLVGVVLFGTLAGSLLPFLLRSLKLDPASASAPAVATLVDVSGLVIYFTVASLILAGTLL